MKIKLKRHESFTLREGWLEKGIEAIRTHRQETFHKEKGIIILGIGANMVKSLKYWMTSCNIITKNVIPTFSSLGENIDRYDRYLESDFSWCFIHYHLVSNFDMCTILNYIFNKYTNNNIHKDTLNTDICSYFNIEGFEYNEKLIKDDINVFLNLYAEDESHSNPEDNIISPLTKLSLIEKIDFNTYRKKQIKLELLDYRVFYYILSDIYKESFELNDAFVIKNGPAKVFNLKKSEFNQYINILSNKGMLTVNRTAGLNMCYFNKKVELSYLFDSYFNGGEA